MKKQRKRSICILLAIVLAAQMMLASGTAVSAEDVETTIVPVNSGVEINGISLVLSGEIGLTFHVVVPPKYRDGTMKLTFMNNEPIVTNISDCPLDNNLRYTVTYYLSAIELSEDVTLAVYDDDGTLCAEKTCSAEEYANRLINDEIATEKEKNIAKKLINYGHYAQLACSETNGWVIGEDYAETNVFGVLSVDTSVFNKYDIKWKNGTPKLRRFSMSLRLDYKTGIHLYFPFEEKPTVTVNGEAVEAIESECLADNYEIFIDGINALHLNDEYEITVNDSTFSLSALCYCKSAIRNASSENTVNAMRALYEFYQAIQDYYVIE